LPEHKVVYRDAVLDEDFARIPRNIQRRIIRAIENRLTTEPTRYGERLRRSLFGLWRLRVGDYRVIYEVQGKTVRIWAVGHRRDAYDEISKRWPAPAS